MNYVTKRRKIKAIQFTGLNRDECTAFCFKENVSHRRVTVNRHSEMLIITETNNILIKERDWIIRFEDGMLAGCENDIFKFYYEKDSELQSNTINIAQLFGALSIENFEKNVKGETGNEYVSD